MNKQIQAQQALKAALVESQRLIRQMALNTQGGHVQTTTRETRGDVAFERLTWKSNDIRVSLSLSQWAGASWWKIEAYDARDPEGSGAAVELANGSDKEDWEVAREYLQDAYDRLSA